jgi:hypothetical protein
MTRIEMMGSNHENYESGVDYADQKMQVLSAYLYPGEKDFQMLYCFVPKVKI